MQVFSIHRVSREEVATLCALAERTFRDAWQDQNEQDAFEQYCREKFSSVNMSAELAAPGTEFYFARMNDKPVAYLKLNIDRLPDPPEDLTDAAGDSKSPAALSGSALQLERIYVLQTIQSQGLGAELLRFTEQRARETGATWIWLSVWQKSPRTIKFYERNGFSIFGVETFWVGNDAQPDWLMRKSLI